MQAEYQESAAYQASQYRNGFAMTLLGVLLITPDALIVRLIDADAWTMVFWRGVLVPTTFLCFLTLRFGPSMIRDSLKVGGTAGIGVALCYTGTTFGFMGALHHTSTANTLVILAASPFFAALLSRLILKERTPPQTWAAIVIGFAGIGVVMFEGLDAGAGRASLRGDAMALFAALMLASSFVLIRRRKEVNMVPATAVGGYFAALIALPFAAPLAVDQDQALLIGLLGVVLLPVCFGLIALGPRRLPAAEVSLLMLLETIIGPIWVWAVIGEVPGPYAVIGGLIVLGALTAHAIWRLKRRPAVSATTG
ncbi:DMT family transporter [Pacificispira sp.]|uniref:DMT family transporter n=1 Tax=Pacificispira sp. TaxID=2888761 RepID=UPI003BAD8E37